VEVVSGVESRRLTRQNFYALGEWAGAFECWGLDAPIPELRIGEPNDFVRARLGDIIVKCPSGVVVLAERP
jgi:hypothetical protein